MSYLVICLDHKIVFRGAGGMANIEGCSVAEFDRVIHLLSREQMIRLEMRLKLFVIELKSRLIIDSLIHKIQTIEKQLDMFVKRINNFFLKQNEYISISDRGH